MDLFIASIVPLVLGPVFVRFLSSRPAMAHALDAFVLFTIGGLVLLHILPEALAGGGIWAVVATAVGLALPVVSGRLFSGPSPTRRRITMVLAMAALAMHALLDGVALSGHGGHDHGHSHSHGSVLGLAVVLHRIPVGLALWWLVYPRYGLRLAIAAVALVLTASTIGFVGGGPGLLATGGAVWFVFQALVAGSLMHVLGHSSHTASSGVPPWVSTVGGLAGIGLLVVISVTHPSLPRADDTLAVGPAFVALAAQSAPALLAGLGLVAALRSYGRRLGLAPWCYRWLPFCTCAARLSVNRGRGPGAWEHGLATALFMVGPEIGFASLFLSFRFWGLEATLIRAGCALLLMFGVAVVLRWCVAAGFSDARSMGDDGPPMLGASSKPDGFSVFVAEINRLCDQSLPWIVTGLLTAALLESLVSPTWLHSVPPALQVVLLVVMGVPLYVCSLGTTPVAAVLTHKNVLFGPVLGLLLAGVVTNMQSISAIAARYGRRAAAAVATVSLVVAGLLGFFVLWVYPRTAHVPLHDVADAGHSTMEWVCLAGLTGLAFLSWLRRGTHGIVESVLRLHGHDVGAKTNGDKKREAKQRPLATYEEGQIAGKKV